MRACRRRTTATVAILAASVSAAAGPIAEDPSAAGAFLKELIEPAPLAPEVRRRIPKLLADLGSGTWEVRRAGSKELLRIGPKAGPWVRKAARDPHAEVASRARELLQAYEALEANRAGRLNEAVDLLIKRKDPTAVDSLVVLLNHTDGSIRHVTEYALRRITGRNFGYNAHAPESERRAAAARWAAWWKASREEFDFVASGKACRVAGILAWNGSTREVFLVGLDGEVIWSRRMPKGFYSADALSNGNLLISARDGSNTALEEYDPGGKIVWRTGNLDLGRLVDDLHRLPGGNTLGIDREKRRVLEIDPSGSRIVWQHPLGEAGALAAQRLPNGNTLLCTFRGEVREITSAGEVVWAKTGLQYVRDARKLPNGNVLTAEMTRYRVTEWTHSGKEAWSWTGTGIGRVIAARRLPDGRTVVQSMGTGLLLVDPTGKRAEVLTLPEARFSCYRQMRLAPAGAEGPAKGKPTRKPE